MVRRKSPPSKSKKKKPSRPPARVVASSLAPPGIDLDGSGHMAASGPTAESPKLTRHDEIRPTPSVLNSEVAAKEDLTASAPAPPTLVVEAPAPAPRAEPVPAPRVVEPPQNVSAPIVYKSVTPPDQTPASPAVLTDHSQQRDELVSTKTTPVSDTQKDPVPIAKSWAERVTGNSRSLKKRGEKSSSKTGDPCVTIPNSVISRNKNAWKNFVLGQFHGTLPSMGALHAILNGIWSNKTKDISISKAGGQSVFIKIPNAATRKRVLDQGVWHIEGQCMFVAAWEPGMHFEIPELKEVPLWVDFRGVPPHFFSAEGLEYISSLVGEPLSLHPRTANMLNMEVARVFTLIDLNETLPESVYVRFESGEEHKIEVSCPWLPPKCSHCHQFGHSLRRCPTAPILCSNCRSTTHANSDCFRAKKTTAPPLKQPAKQWKPVNGTSTTPHVVLTSDEALLANETQISKEAQTAKEAQTSNEAPAANAVANVSDFQTRGPIGSDVAQVQSVGLPNGRSHQPAIETTPTKTIDHTARSRQGIRINDSIRSDIIPRKSSRMLGKGKDKVSQQAMSSDDSSDTDIGSERMIADGEASLVTCKNDKPSKGRGSLHKPLH